MPLSGKQAAPTSAKSTLFVEEYSEDHSAEDESDGSDGSDAEMLVSRILQGETESAPPLFVFGKKPSVEQPEEDDAGSVDSSDRPYELEESEDVSESSSGDEDMDGSENEEGASRHAANPPRRGTVGPVPVTVAADAEDDTNHLAEDNKEENDAPDDNQDFAASLSRNRYWMDPAQSMVCFNCGKRGHMRADCPDGTPCFFCGSRDHEPSQCYTGSCFSCFLPGHRIGDCPRKRVSNMTCRRCNLYGHGEMQCPDIWRDYVYAETKGKDMHQNKKEATKWCFQCASKKHWGEDCPRWREMRSKPRKHSVFISRATLEDLRYDGSLLQAFGENRSHEKKDHRRSGGDRRLSAQVEHRREDHGRMERGGQKRPSPPTEHGRWRNNDDEYREGKNKRPRQQQHQDSPPMQESARYSQAPPPGSNRNQQPYGGYNAPQQATQQGYYPQQRPQYSQYPQQSYQQPYQQQYQQPYQQPYQQQYQQQYQQPYQQPYGSYQGYTQDNQFMRSSAQPQYRPPSTSNHAANKNNRNDGRTNTKFAPLFRGSYASNK